MVEPPVPLTALSEDQRAQAPTRFTIIRPALEDGITQAQVARTHHISKSTIGRWVKRYREHGLAGLADVIARSDKGTSRRLPTEAVTLIEGLALQTPPRTIAAIHRQVCTIAKARKWNVPSYDSVIRSWTKMPGAMRTSASRTSVCSASSSTARKSRERPSCTDPRLVAPSVRANMAG